MSSVIIIDLNKLLYVYRVYKNMTTKISHLFQNISKIQLDNVET